MNKVSEKYKSEFGWSMTLPPSWKRLARKNPDVYAPVAVFSTPEDWTLSLTWMASRKKSDDDALIAFDSATMIPGALELTDAKQTAAQIFPLLGEIVRATAVQLPDGKRALELVEIICTDDAKKVKKVCYSLILPRRQRGEYRNKLHFQKLSFIAPPDVFHEQIQTVVKAARSFHYPSAAA
ncbi:MAG: hypothetical protein SGJ27_29480 [Candidatus Melainabacteria bacterium]|nr:hypothetical protein [Candidatus Melainabacteria bacterium]